MTSRQQQKGTGSGIQYEDLVPKSEWKDQPEATLLSIDLPGFAKEQIKVTYVHTSKMIRVTGERPLADRRWSRFNEVFSVPQNCLVDKIHGSFKNNILTITMPKEKITKMTNLPEPSRIVAEKVEKLEEKRLLEESKRKEKEDLEAERKKKKLLEEKEELIRKLQEEAKAKEIAEAKKLQEEEAKAKEIAKAKKLQEEAKARERLEAKKLQEEEAKAKEELEKRKLEEEATLEKKRKIQEKILNQEERKLPEVVYTKPGLGTGIKAGSEKVGEVVKAAEEKLGYVVEKEKKMGKGIMEKIRGKDIMEKIRGKEMTSEEKKLMVNVGVAALVIFALGAYVSYTFCSSSSSSSSSSPSSSSSSTKPE